jgi:hypothetical protein
MPVYVKHTFYNGEVIRTHGVNQASTCKWKFKHVFLLGLMDGIKLKRLVGYKPLEFEIHDKDQRIDKKARKEQTLNSFPGEGDDYSEEEEAEVMEKGKMTTKKRRKVPKKKEEKQGKGKKKGKGEENVKEFKGVNLDDFNVIDGSYGIASF